MGGLDPNDEPYNVFTKDAAIPKTEPLEGFVVVEKDSGLVVSISPIARKILDFDQQSNLKPTILLEDLFYISEEEPSHLYGARTWDFGHVTLVPISRNPDCYDTKISICNWGKHDTFTIAIEAHFYGIQNAKIHARLGAPDVFYIWQSDGPSSPFDSLRLLDTNHIELLGEGSAGLENLLGQRAHVVFRRLPPTDTTCDAYVSALHAKKKMEMNLPPEDVLLWKNHWIECFDGSYFVSFAPNCLFYSVVNLLPNGFTIQRLFCVHKKENNVLNPISVGADMWDWPPGQQEANTPLATYRYGNDVSKRFYHSILDPVGKSLSNIAPVLIQTDLPSKALEALKTGRAVQIRETQPRIDSLGESEDKIYNFRFQPLTKTCVISRWSDVSTVVRTRILMDRLNRLLDNAPLLCLLTTRTLHVAYMNEYGKKLVHIPLADPSFVLSRFTAMDFLPELMKGGEIDTSTFSISPVHTTLRCLDGSSVSVVASLTCIAGRTHRSNGTPEEAVYFAVFAREIGTGVELEERLKDEIKRAEDAASAKSDFLATMSHEIRTPLHGIIGCAELIQASSQNPWQQQLINSIHNCSASLLAIINDILDFSKIESRKIELETTPFEFSDVIDSCISVVAPELQCKQQTLIYSICDSCPPKVIGDASRSRQIVLNLLSNSVKFSPEGSTIEIGVCVCSLQDRSQCKQQTQFEECRHIGLEEGCFRRLTCREAPNKTHVFRFFIRDSGCGMNEAQMGQLFEPFVQFRAVGSSKGKGLHRGHSGTGLGLSIARKLVEVLGGGISVRAAESKGCCFSVWIPVDVTASTPVLEGAGSTQVAWISTSPTEMAAANSLLVHDGFCPKTFNSIREFLQQDQQRPGYTVIFIDIGHCGCPVEESLEQLKSFLIPMEASRICFISDLEHQSEVQSYLKKDTQLMVWIKPVSATILKAIVDSACHVPEADRETPTEEDRVRILIVEDNVTNRFVLHRMLLNLGVPDSDIIEADDGVSCLEVLRKEPFDIVLMDIHMPRMSGWEAASRLRQNPSKFQKCGMIIAISAATTLAEREESLKNMDMFLSKPLQMGKLAQVLNHACKKLNIRRKFQRRQTAGEEAPPVQRGSASIFTYKNIAIILVCAALGAFLVCKINSTLYS